MKDKLCYKVFKMQQVIENVQNQILDLTNRIDHFDTIIDQKNRRINYLEVLTYGTDTNIMTDISLPYLDLTQSEILTQKEQTA